MMKKTLCMMGVALGLLASSSYASPSTDNYLNPKNAQKLVQTYHQDLAHRFDTVHLTSSVGLKTVLSEMSYDPAGVLTQANVSASDKTCTVDVNLAQLQNMLKEESFHNNEIDIFVKFAILHERFHCVVFDDQESVWLPGARHPTMTTDIFSEHTYSSPATMQTTHANAYEFIHEGLADGMALVATLKEIVPANAAGNIGNNIPHEYHHIIKFIIGARMNSTLKAGDVHGTLRMLDFVLTQPVSALNKPLDAWYTKMKKEAGIQLFDSYHQDGMDTVLTERDMAYHYQASVIASNNNSITEQPKSWMDFIVKETKKDLLERGIVDHSNAREIQKLIKGNTQSWVNTVEWRQRSEELHAINKAFQAYQSAEDLSALATDEGRISYFKSRGLE